MEALCCVLFARILYCSSLFLTSYSKIIEEVNYKNSGLRSGLVCVYVSRVCRNNGLATSLLFLVEINPLSTTSIQFHIPLPPHHDFANCGRQK